MSKNYHATSKMREIVFIDISEVNKKYETKLDHLKTLL